MCTVIVGCTFYSEGGLGSILALKSLSLVCFLDNLGRYGLYHHTCCSIFRVSAFRYVLPCGPLQSQHVMVSYGCLVRSFFIPSCIICADTTARPSSITSSFIIACTSIRVKAISPGLAILTCQSAVTHSVEWYKFLQLGKIYWQIPHNNNIWITHTPQTHPSQKLYTMQILFC